MVVRGRARRCVFTVRTLAAGGGRRHDGRGRDRGDRRGRSRDGRAEVDRRERCRAGRGTGGCPGQRHSRDRLHRRVRATPTWEPRQRHHVRLPVGQCLGGERRVRRRARRLAPGRDRHRDAGAALEAGGARRRQLHGRHGGRSCGLCRNRGGHRLRRGPTDGRDRVDRRCRRVRRHAARGHARSRDRRDPRHQGPAGVRGGARRESGAGRPTPPSTVSLPPQRTPSTSTSDSPTRAERSGRSIWAPVPSRGRLG
jgi:hypothetical protein